jgi:hypothetical protein
VGLSSNFDNRLYIANLEGYAEIWDWVVRDYCYVQQMGRVEARIKRELSDYGVTRTWIRNGKVTSAREVFSCALKFAREILHQEAARE